MAFGLIHVARCLGCCLAVLLLAAGSDGTVAKRNVYYQFKPMVEALTGCSALDYLDHGCWCGLGHKGEDVVDGIDGCCKVHDTCYDVVQKVHGCEPLESNYAYSKANCTDQRGSCGHLTCLCDQAAAACFQQFGCPQGHGNCPAPDHKHKAKRYFEMDDLYPGY
nr:phospholipase A2 [Inimicus japonicus]